MKIGKAISLDNIPMEFWKCLGDDGLEWLMELFNDIFRTTKMSHEWRFSTIILLYKNKDNIQDCNNYRGIKLLSHMMKLWQRVIEWRFRESVRISKKQLVYAR